jgi:hypothetical protein
VTGLMDRVADWLRGTPELDHQRRLGNAALVDRLIERCCGDQQMAERYMRDAVHAHVKQAERYPDLSEAWRAEWARKEAANFWETTLSGVEWALKCS